MDAADSGKPEAGNWAVLLSAIPGLRWQTTAQELLDGDLEPFLGFVLAFESEHHADLEKVVAALGVGDRDVAKSLCHKLKGASGTLGFDDLFLLLKEIEQILKQGGGSNELTRLADSLGRMLEEIFAGVELVRTKLNSHG